MMANFRRVASHGGYVLVRIGWPRRSFQHPTSYRLVEYPWLATSQNAPVDSGLSALVNEALAGLVVSSEVSL